MKAFVDSGGWYSMLVESDLHHAAGRRYVEEIIRARAVVVTSDFVLDEVITRLRYDAGHAAAAQFLAWVKAARANGILTVLSVDERAWRRAEAIFLQYADTKLSFTDCTSFALLEEHPADEVFGYDGHFAMMGHSLRPPVGG